MKKGFKVSGYYQVLLCNSDQSFPWGKFDD